MNADELRAPRVDLRGADLTHARLIAADLSGADLYHCVTDDGTLIAVVRFDSAEAARRNSGRA